jgi:hypothetical protein
MQYRQLMTDQELKFRGEMDVARSSADAQKHMMEGRLREMEAQTKAMEQDYYKEKQAALTASNKLAEYTDKLETDMAQHRTLQQKLDGVMQQLAMKESLVAQLEASMTASSEQKEHMHATFLQVPKIGTDPPYKIPGIRCGVLLVGYKWWGKELFFRPILNAAGIKQPFRICSELRESRVTSCNIISCSGIVSDCCRDISCRDI